MIFVFLRTFQYSFLSLMQKNFFKKWDADVSITRYPPSPPRQQKSAFGLPPSPPFSADVIYEWSPMNQYFNGKSSIFLTEVNFDTSEENQLWHFQNGYFFKILLWFHEAHNWVKCWWKNEIFFSTFYLHFTQLCASWNHQRILKK